MQPMHFASLTSTTWSTTSMIIRPIDRLMRCPSSAFGLNRDIVESDEMHAASSARSPRGERCHTSIWRARSCRPASRAGRLLLQERPQPRKELERVQSFDLRLVDLGQTLLDGLEPREMPGEPG